MPVPNPRLKRDITDDLDHHASQVWPQLGEVTVRWRGGYGYVTAHLDTDDDADEGPGIPLCRLGYLGLDHEWEFALYDPATDTYHDTALPDGSFTGTPQDALDCACRVPCIVGTASALPGLIAMTYALSNGDRIAPAIDPILYTGIVVFTFVLVLTATALPARAIMRAHRPA